MKFYPKLNKYKASNLEYDVNTEMAFSYEWYWLAKRYNGLMVLNYYSYSPTTVRHIYKIRNLFDQLGIQYFKIEAPQGLQNLDAAIEHYERLIADIQEKLDNPRSKKTLRVERECLINSYNERIRFIDNLRASS